MTHPPASHLGALFVLCAGLVLHSPYPSHGATPDACALDSLHRRPNAGLDRHLECGAGRSDSARRGPLAAKHRRRPAVHPQRLPDRGGAGWAARRLRPHPARGGSGSARLPRPDLRQEQGYLLALAVDPRYARQGIGTRLLHAAAAQLRAQGATRIVLGGGPGHLVPGVPHAGASGGFWARHDYRDPQVVADVRGDLRGGVAPPRPPGLTGGLFAMRQGRTGEEAAILTWLDGAFPGDWPYGLRRSFAGGYRPSDVTLLVDAQAAIQGFCCTFHPTSGWLGGGSLYFPPGGGADWGGLGPLGIAAGVRGQGLGQAIVAVGLAYLQSRGVRRCGIDWIVLREFYGQLGFQVWQEYDRYEKPLDP